MHKLPISPHREGVIQMVPDAFSIGSGFQPNFGLVTSYSYTPSLSDLQGGSDGLLSRFQVGGHLTAAIGLGRRAFLDLDVPMQYSPGQSVLLGDSVVRLRGTLFGHESSRLSMGIDGGAWLPSGDPAQFTGDGAARYMARALFSGTTEKADYSFNLGYYDRSFQVVQPDEWEIGSSLVFGVATGIKLKEGKFYVGPEIAGMTMIDSEAPDTGAFNGKSTPVEAMISSQFQNEFIVVQAGIGRGI